MAAKDKARAEFARETFVDLDATLRFAALAQPACVGEDVQQLHAGLTRGILEKALRHVHGRAESPIEKILLSAVVCSLWGRCGYMPLIPEERVFAWMESGEGPCPDVFRAIYDGLGGWKLPHLVCQYSPAGTRLDAAIMGNAKLRRMRVDSLWFVPTQPDRPIIIECDGHEWHKARFTADKQRDRTLQRAGFTVLRFSGTEIYEDAFAAADQVLAQFEITWGPVGWGA